MIKTPKGLTLYDIQSSGSFAFDVRDFSVGGEQLNPNQPSLPIYSGSQPFVVPFYDPSSRRLFLVSRNIVSIMQTTLRKAKPPTLASLWVVNVQFFGAPHSSIRRSSFASHYTSKSMTNMNSIA
jgi:hypothetical protein